jgi:hypothetical protein
MSLGPRAPPLFRFRLPQAEDQVCFPLDVPKRRRKAPSQFVESSVLVREMQIRAGPRRLQTSSFGDAYSETR